MSKRPNEDEDDSHESRRLNFNCWKENASETLTPPSTPTNSSSKFDFNIWNKTRTSNGTSNGTPNAITPIKLCELDLGLCFKRRLCFRVSLKTDKRTCSMFHFHTNDGNYEMQVRAFPEQTEKSLYVRKIDSVCS